jgi:Mg-chelatase subunit ChlD
VQQARTQSINNTTMSDINTATTYQDSQNYDDDIVYSVVVPDQFEQGNHPEPEPAAAATAAATDRPDQSKKATKNIKVIIVQDLSGSMDGSRSKLATGVNEFASELKMRYEAPCDFTAQICLVTFAGDNIDVGQWMDIHSVPVYTRDSFRCNGTTPLWKSCKIALDKVTEECRDCTAAIYVFTDGEDNNSNGLTSKDIRDMIEKLDATKHTLLFIGSDDNSGRDAQSAGLTRHRSLNPTEQDTPFAMRACTNTIARCVTGETQTPEFNDDDIMTSEGSRHQSAHSAVYHGEVINDVDDEEDGVPSIRRYQSAGGRG